MGVGRGWRWNIWDISEYLFTSITWYLSLPEIELETNLIKHRFPIMILIWIFSIHWQRAIYCPFYPSHPVLHSWARQDARIARHKIYSFMYFVSIEIIRRQLEISWINFSNTEDISLLHCVDIATCTNMDISILIQYNTATKTN